MKHTPLPWKVGDAIKFYVDSQDVGHEANVVITSAHGRIADVMGSEMGYLNAKFIVHSVNNFPAAVALLREITKKEFIDGAEGYLICCLEDSIHKPMCPWMKAKELLTRLDQENEK